ncbi:lysine N(6)-hydroxylase/L-ornithine N(5)-oxygenase family protein [Saccharothrix australiensis]|uniref:L-lysine N6-monooxygenase MbtG n=1 Tax=Saccharothrix australiensis TaxID=2072 RepID=A0A495W1R7_9PSEU|nr:SidA/IucD/PvdA family monooxygenase [Saccharothrix australiensis]RKT54663.1 L-ornithine N5-oxygenase [Saccharothrix australiensis]
MTRRPGRAAVDVAGIGFGPSNLALAVALRETAGDDLAWAFTERKPRFGWHVGMLIEGATMQVSFLKDLVTMRNPASTYSFVSYLHAHGRLPQFINGKTLYPGRVEFHDYLTWVARDFETSVDYGTEVVAARPVVDNGVVTHLDVVGRSVADGTTAVRRARNVVIATGLVPVLPPGIVASRRVRHSAGLLDHTADLARSGARRIVVVGAGQSAAEAVEHLHRSFPRADVYAVHSRFGYSAADDNPFANAVFDPSAVDLFHGANEEVKQLILGYHANTNYSVVDADLVELLHRRHYDELVTGANRLRLLNASRVRSLVEDDDGVRLEVEFLPTGEVRALAADAVVFATGYRPADPSPLLAGIAAECKRDAADRLVLDRDHRVVTSAAVTAGIYVHGAAAEPSHGLASGLLSTTAVRAGEIARSILGRTR